MRPKRIKEPVTERQTFAFSAKDLALAEPREVEFWIHDPATRGLAVKVLVSGRKVFVLRFRTETNRQRKLTLGTFPEMKVQQARKVAARHWAQIFNGDDPAQSKADRKTIRLAELVEIYLRDEAKPRLSPSTYKRYKAVLRTRVVPRIGSIPLADLNRSDVESLHRSMASTPVNANRMLAVLKAMLNKAEDWDILPLHSNPASRIKMNNEQRRIRYFNEHEQARIFRAIDVLRPRMLRCKPSFDAIMLLFYTGCRPGEVLRLRWEDIDFGRKSASLHATKTGDAKLPLSTSAIELLQSIAATSSCPWVFPGADPSRYLTTLVRPWRRACDEANLKNARLHDIRHTVATYIAATGNLYSAQVILRHTDPKMTKDYAHPYEAAVRRDLDEAMDKIGANRKVALEMDSKNISNIEKLKKGANNEPS